MLWKLREGRHRPLWGQTREDILEEGALKNGKGFSGSDGGKQRGWWERQAKVWRRLVPARLL